MGKSRYYLFAIPVLFTAFLAIIMFHDNGVPNSISEGEKTYVLSVLVRADEQMDAVIQKLEQLNEQPELELEACAELADLIDSWWDTMDCTRSESVFFVPFPEANEANTKLLSKVESELDQAIANFIEGATSRTEVNNNAVYDILRSALTRKEQVHPDAPCVTKECMLCRSREALKRFLIRHVAHFRQAE